MKSKLKLKVVGKNPNLFFRRLISNGINIYNLSQIDYKTIEIVILEEDYEKLMKIRSVYDVTILNSYGIRKVRELIRKNKILMISLIISILLVYMLSNIIFKIEIVHNDSNIRQLLSKELESNGIKKYSIKKDYHSIQRIKNGILNKYKDKLEWIEIENIGTKYVVRVEERKINKKRKESAIRNIVAKKSATIRRIYTKKGEAIKGINDYVNKGDVVISGEIKLNDESKNMVSASGTVYGEVWYKVKVDMPLEYHEKKYTGRSKKVYVINFLNYSFELFNFNKFKDKEKKSKVILKDMILPISIEKQYQKEIIRIDKKYKEEQAITAATNYALDKVRHDLKEKEYIIGKKDLKVALKDSKIEMNVFVAVCENITQYQSISVNDDLKKE